MKNTPGAERHADPQVPRRTTSSSASTCPTAPGRTQRITKAPRWCAVDLRDGNQALIDPMSPERKRIMFDLLVRMGYKEIEVGFPSASQTDFDFVRSLIEEDAIPDDVTIQVLTQAREHLIKRTYESLIGAKQAIVHLYNSTSILQRDVVFRTDKQGIIDIALDGARLCRQMESMVPGTTDLLRVLARELHRHRARVRRRHLQPGARGLRADARAQGHHQPARRRSRWPRRTSTPTRSSGCRGTSNHRENVILSLHPHNDRGTAVAAAELGYLAGADRIEGCLFGNGERTGNVDLVALGHQPVHAGHRPADRLQRPRRRSSAPPSTATSCRCTSAARGPATSSSPPSAARTRTPSRRASRRWPPTPNAQGKTVDDLVWAVPYLPVDPKDLGRSYEAVIRVNSQSGKGGVAYLLKTDHALDLPRKLQIEFSGVVQAKTDAEGGEVTSDQIWAIFQDEYLPAPGRPTPTTSGAGSSWAAPARRARPADHVEPDGDAARRRHASSKATGSGNGPIAAFLDVLNQPRRRRAPVRLLAAHAVGERVALAAAYVELDVDGDRALGRRHRRGHLDGIAQGRRLGREPRRPRRGAPTSRAAGAGRTA